MIECSAGYLEYGARGILRALQKKGVRSRRCLHSAFWSHGAGSINLPPWWILLLQSPIDGPDRYSRKAAAFPKSAVMSSLQGVFLDFLYPVQTLALVRRLKRSTDAHEQAAYDVKRCTRGYTSIATALLSDQQEERSDPQGYAIRQDRAHIKTDAEATGKRLKSLLGAQELTTSCNALWQAYQDAIEQTWSISSRDLVKLFRHLSASRTQVDTERLLALFESMPVHDRRAIHYSYAVSAALHLKDTNTAYHAHREALSRLHSAVGASALLTHAVKKEDWSLATGVWSPFWDSGLFYYTRSEIWNGVDCMSLDVLMKRVVSAVDFVACRLQKRDHREIVSELDFVRELGKKALRRRGVEFDIPLWRAMLAKLDDLSREGEVPGKAVLQVFALKQALSVRVGQYNVAATDYYHDVRPQNTKLRSERSLLRTMLRRCQFPESLTVVQELVHDMRAGTERLDHSAYAALMGKLAKAGQADVLDDIFQSYCNDHGTPRDLKVFRALIHVHCRRADPNKAVEAFDSLQNKYGPLPDISLYNDIVHAFARVDDAEGAWIWYDKAQKAGLTANQSTYFSLLRIYSKRGDQDAVDDLLRRAQNDGVKPSTPMLHLQVQAKINDGRLDEAESVVQQTSKDDHVKGITLMWNTVMNAYALRKNLLKVQQLHQHMQNIGVPSDSGSYAALITGLSVAGFPHAAFKVLRKVMPAVGIRPTTLHYATVMGGALRIRTYDLVFRVYKHMLEHNISPDLSTQNVVLRAAAAVDGCGEGEKQNSHEYTRARQILNHTVASLDPSELASSEPRKFVGPHRLDEAFTSTYFEHMIFLYGKSGAFDQVSEIYDKYIQTARKFSDRDVESSPPMLMLSALLVAHKRAGNFEEVERCWYLAVEKCDILSRKASVKDLAQPNWVLPARSLVINRPLEQYISHLGEQKRFDDMISVVDDLLRDGYQLSHANWNTYIQFLCQGSKLEHHLLAFTLCEAQLMPTWRGWQSMGHVNRIKSRFKGMAKEQVSNTTGKAPTYRTLVWLAKAYVNLGLGRTKAKLQAAEKVREKGSINKTLDAVSNMPMWDDYEQRSILGRGPYSG